jgi:hypothetical protein
MALQKRGVPEDFVLSGGILYKDKVYVSVDSVATMLSQYPKVTGKELAKVFESVVKDPNLPAVREGLCGKVEEFIKGLLPS